MKRVLFIFRCCVRLDWWYERQIRKIETYNFYDSDEYDDAIESVDKLCNELGIKSLEEEENNDF